MLEAEWSTNKRWKYNSGLFHSRQCGTGKVYHFGTLWYEGEWVDCKAHGKGTKYYNNGKPIYTGDFVNGKAHGKGTKYYNNGKPIYTGDFVNGKAHGKGKSYYKSGKLEYEGEWADDKRCGKGKSYYESGKLEYEGEWADGSRRKGKGYYKSGKLKYEVNEAYGKRKEYYESGKLKYEIDGYHCKEYYETGKLEYEGEWTFGKRCGKGKWYYETGELLYEGAFVDDKCCGKGKWYYQNGKLRFEGNFVDGKPVVKQTTPPIKQTTPPIKQTTLPAKQTTPSSTQNIKQPQRPKQVSSAGADTNQYLEELDVMIGLNAVKRQVRELINVIRAQKERERRNLTTTTISYHMVFTGNPGTGKTTVARLIGKIYADLGVVSKGNLVETDRTGLVGQYIGQTAKETDKKIKEAMGGILFIDEAYSLVPEDASGRDYGKEAIDCLLKRMEDYREDFVVIVAGYEEPMQRFLDSNPGLQSRFNHYIHFENYGLQELGQILAHICKKNGAILHPETLKRFLTLVEGKLTDPAFQKKFSNGRYVRNVFDKLTIARDNRLSSVNLSTVDNVTLNEILVKDLQYLVDTGDFDNIF